MDSRRSTHEEECATSKLSLLQFENVGFDDPEFYILAGLDRADRKLDVCYSSLGVTREDFDTSFEVFRRDKGFI